MKTLTTKVQSDATRQATDTEILDWLAERSFFPNDHPEDDLVVLVPERFAAWGKFTANVENDKRALREAVRQAMNVLPYRSEKSNTSQP